MITLVNVIYHINSTK